MKYILLIAILGCQLGMTACKKYLDKKADTAQVVPNTITDLQSLLNDYYVMNSQTPALGEASADDYFVLMNRYNTLSENNRRAYIWELSGYNFGNDWDQSYTPVYVTNYCLEKIMNIRPMPGQQESWQNVIGSAYFFRAFYYLNLAWNFAKTYDVATADTDLGIVLRTGADFNVPSVRASVRQTYDRIIKDLQEANRYLPDFPRLQVTQPSKAASFALLARTYLSMRIYDSAYKYSNLSLQIKNELLDYNSAEVTTTAVPFQPFNREILFHTLQSGNYPSKFPSNAMVDTVLMESYHTDDRRRTVFFDGVSGYHRFKGSYASNATRYFTGLAVDETLLIRAESNARLNRLEVAYSDLNALLLKRFRTGTFIPLHGTNQQEAITLILGERRKQLLMRGIRWSDIKRLNKEGRNIVPKRIIEGREYSLQPNESRYALPLPEDIIVLTGMPQN